MNWTPEQDAEILRRRQAGETFVTIAAAFNVSKNAVVSRYDRKLRLGEPHKKRAKIVLPPVAPRRKQTLPGACRCLYALSEELPYEWCGRETDPIWGSWCAEHYAVVYRPMVVQLQRIKKTTDKIQYPR